VTKVVTVTASPRAAPTTSAASHPAPASQSGQTMLAISGSGDGTTSQFTVGGGAFAPERQRRYFLSNAATWRGADAGRIKKLRGML
jgi:hypothetical protein